MAVLGKSTVGTGTAFSLEGKRERNNGSSIPNAAATAISLNASSSRRRRRALHCRGAEVASLALERDGRRGRVASRRRPCRARLDRSLGFGT